MPHSGHRAAASLPGKPLLSAVRGMIADRADKRSSRQRVVSDRAWPADSDRVAGYWYDGGSFVLAAGWPGASPLEPARENDYGRT